MIFHHRLLGRVPFIQRGSANDTTNLGATMASLLEIHDFE